MTDELARHDDNKVTSLLGVSAISGETRRIRTDDSGRLLTGASFAPSTFDEIDLGYTGSNLTSVVYKSAGVTQATLTLAYSGSNLSTIVRS